MNHTIENNQILKDLIAANPTDEEVHYFTRVTAETKRLLQRITQLRRLVARQTGAPPHEVLSWPGVQAGLMRRTVKAGLLPVAAEGPRRISARKLLAAFQPDATKHRLVLLIICTEALFGPLHKWLSESMAATNGVTQVTPAMKAIHNLRLTFLNAMLDPLNKLCVRLSTLMDYHRELKSAP